MRWFERLELTQPDARVLRATDLTPEDRSDPLWERTAARIAERVGCREDVAASCWRRLRGQMLVVIDGRLASGWLRTRDGDLVLEHQP